jgi:hypothetical protein
METLHAKDKLDGDAMILDKLRQLLAPHHLSTRVLPAQEALLQLENDTWEGEIDWNGGRSHVAISFVAPPEGPSTLHRSQIDSAIQRLESLEVVAREALRSATTIRLTPDRFWLFAFDVGDESDLDDGRCALSFNHPDDPAGFYNVHFADWAVGTVVRND